MSNDMEKQDDDTRLEQRLRAFRGPKPPDSVWETVEERIDVRRTGYWFRWVAAAAAVALVGVTLVFIYLHLRWEDRGAEEWPSGETAARGIDSLPGSDALVGEISLMKFGLVMSKNSEELMSYVDSHNRPIRTNEDLMTALHKRNGA
ncbi:MAG: hypothetical protein AB1696_12855 [Planctomycetota bacterium]